MVVSFFLRLRRILTMHQLRRSALLWGAHSAAGLFCCSKMAASCLYHILSWTTQFWCTSFSSATRWNHRSFKTCLTVSFGPFQRIQWLFCSLFKATTELVKVLLPYYEFFASVVVWERYNRAIWPRRCILSRRQSGFGGLQSGKLFLLALLTVQGIWIGRFERAFRL